MSSSRPPARRRRKILPQINTLTIGAVFVALTAIGLVVATKQQEANVNRADALGGVMADKSGPFANYLLVGSDTRETADPNSPDYGGIGSTNETGGRRSDTVMIMHVDNELGVASIMSLPRDLWIDVPGYGKIKYDMAFGGNFYAIIPIDRIGIEFKRENGQKFLTAGLAISDAINQQNRPVHPENPDIAVCHHIDFIAPGNNSLHWKNAMAIHPGWFDRSPCGTGTSARLAQMVARGEFSDSDVLKNESWIGSHFEARIKERTKVAGLDAIVPMITGRAWVMGEATWTLDPNDPFPNGFIV